MSWLFDLAYFALLVVVSPILLWRMAIRGKYRTGWGEKLFGRVHPRDSHAPCLWFQAVSVGEVLQLEPVVAELRRRLPGVEFVISTTTPTGLSVARSKFPADRVCYFPLDFSWAVREAIRRLRPTAIVLVELELWPNFVFAARRAGIPLALINGRVSQRSSRGYGHIRPLMSQLLGCFELLAAQNAVYAERLSRLGAPQDRLQTTGSIKFDRVTTDRDNVRTLELRRFFGIGPSERVFIAGSTQAPEEAAAIDAYTKLKRTHPELRLIVVPRHIERFEEVARLIEARGLPLVRRSLEAGPSRAEGAEPPVLLLDTLGELAACWGLADVAFVGGSLGNRGGQNMIEPAGYGATLLFGPNTQNFREVVEMLLAEDAARVVHNGADLTTALAHCLADPAAAASAGRRAQQLVLAQQGATARTVELLANLSCFSHRAGSRRLTQSRLFGFRIDTRIVKFMFSGEPCMSKSTKMLFTSESVSMGHPDKVADQISDGILDALLEQDPQSRVACETLCTTDLVVLAGEITSRAKIDHIGVTRSVIRDIGYTSDDIGFNADTCRIFLGLHSQSGDIAMGVDRDGAGDQGLMFGYACKQTDELMPLPIALSHRILSLLTDARKNKEVDWLRPDSKSQVTVEYEGRKPIGIPAIVVSTQHADSVDQAEIAEFVRKRIVPRAVPEHLLTRSTQYHINPTGRFVIGGPHGDCGLTGRKIIVDTYGGWGRHGGGAFSGKDPTKVDRSAAYMARHVAKNVVAGGLADECEMQLAYAIGVAEPVGICVDTNGTNKVSEERIATAVREIFPLTPKGIIEYLKLRRPIFRKTASGGHFGRNEPDFTWEKTDRAKDLAKAAGL